MEELWSAKQYGGTDAGSIYNKQVQELLIELGGKDVEEEAQKDIKEHQSKGVADGGHEEVSADYWGHTQQAKMNAKTMGFTYLGIAVVHYRLRLIGVLTGKRTAFLREHMTGSAEDNPRIMVVIRSNSNPDNVYFLLLFPPETTCKHYDKRNPLKSCTIDNNLRSNHEFDVMTLSNLEVTEVEGAHRGFTDTGSDTFYLQDPNVRDRQGHHRILEISALLPGHSTEMHDPGGKLESSVRDIEGRKAIYVLLRSMIETGTIPKDFPPLSSVVARYNSKSESPSSLWNSSVDTIPFAGLAVADTRSVSLKSDDKKDYHHDNNKIPLVSATLIQQRMNTAGGKVCDHTNKQYV